MLKKIINELKVPKQRDPITQVEAVDELYDLWRDRILYSIVGGYAIFYFCRKNLTTVMPYFLEDMQLSKSDMGLILGVHSLLYGLSKFLSGVLADKSNARYFMALGLFFSALMNIFFGLSSTLVFFGIFWVANALFQGSGVPPCGRLLTFWYSRKESGRYWGIWNSSHQIGGGVIAIFAAYLAVNHGWRMAFFVPAGIAILTSLFLVNRLRDTPESLGLPDIQTHKKEPVPRQDQDGLSIGVMEILFKHVLNQPLIWIVCLANFFVYIVRIGLMDWGVTYLVQAKSMPLTNSGIVIFLFEIIGLLGAFMSGYLSDKFTNGKRGLVSIIYMLSLIGFLFFLWSFNGTNFWILAGIFSALGFFVYGPQMLVAVVAAGAAGKNASATAVGLTGLFGYLGAATCSVATGYISDLFGWEASIFFYLISAVVGTLLFVMTLGFENKMEKDV